MLDKLTSADFTPHVNDTFAVHYNEDEAPLTVELLEVNELKGEDDSKRRPFSLIFRSDNPEQFLQQAIYTLKHDELGEMGLFMVPLGPDEQGMRYEVLFT